MSSYSKNLLGRVINDSVSNIWDEAVKEWEITDWDEDPCQSSKCICGKENLLYLYTITNTKNGNQLFPIGSQCIKKFEREDLNNIVNEKESFFNLLNHVKKGDFLSLKESGFTRKIITNLYKNGVFKASSFNDNDGENDYIFMLKMFNQRKEPTKKQQGKITWIILNEVKPFLMKMLIKNKDRK